MLLFIKGELCYTSIIKVWVSNKQDILQTKINVWSLDYFEEYISSFLSKLNFKKIRGITDFSDQFRKIIMRYKRTGYNLNVMRQSACLVINPITVDGYATLFNCTPVDRASDSMMAPT